MTKLLFAVDRLSETVGKAAGWTIVVLTLLISYEVFSRYALGRHHAWSTDVQLMLYGALFMLGGAYTLSKSGHVRGDIIYGFLRPRAQALIDLTLYICFFFPGVIALAYAGYGFAADSWAIGELSSTTADGPPIYPFKMIIPVAGTLLFLQGVVELVRCVLCLKTGLWPAREPDIEEVDVDKLRELVKGVRA